MVIVVLAIVIFGLISSKRMRLSWQCALFIVVVSVFSALLALAYSCAYNFLLAGSWEESRCFDRFLLLKYDNSGRGYVSGLILVAASFSVFIKQWMASRHPDRQSGTRGKATSIKTCVLQVIRFVRNIWKREQSGGSSNPD